MEVGFLIKWLNPIFECQHLFLFVLSFGLNSWIWVFRHFQWVLEFAFKDSSQSFSTWKLGYASAIQKTKQNTFSGLCFLSVLSLFNSYLKSQPCYSLDGEPWTTHFLSQASAPIRNPTAVHFRPRQALLNCGGVWGGRPALHTQWMALPDHSGNNEAFQSTKQQSWALCHQKSGVEGHTLFKDLQVVLLGVETRLLC